MHADVHSFIFLCYKSQIPFSLSSSSDKGKALIVLNDAQVLWLALGFCRARVLVTQCQLS